jgi:hypothetical protein
MFQPKISRTFAAAAFTALTLLPLSGLQAAPLRAGQPGESRVAQRFEERELSVWRFVTSVIEKLGARIDDNGSKLGARIDDNGRKLGARIDDNG